MVPSAVIAAVVVAVHGRTIGFGFTELDDRDLVVDDHPFLAHPANLVHAFGRAYMHVVDRAHAYYRPLVTISYGLDAQWSGLRPAGYHATNVALHATAAVLLFSLLLRFEMPAVVAMAGALVFAVHPALASAVAWIPGRNDSLLTVFALASWLFWLRDRSHPSLMDRTAHFAFFALALLTKETALALPLVWAAQAVIVDRGQRQRDGDPGRTQRDSHPGRTRRDRDPGPRLAEAITYGIGWLAIAGAYLLIHGHFGPGGLGTSGGAAEASWLVESPGVLGAKTSLLVGSLGKVVVPFAPTVLAVAADVSLWPGVVAAVALATGAIFFVGVRRRVVAFGCCAFVALLAPALVTPGTLVLDNRLYLPACGIVLASCEISRAAAFERAAPVEPRLFLALGLVLAFVLAAMTVLYEEAFRDGRSFAREAVAGSPHSPLAHFCLGQSYQVEGNVDRALAEYEMSLALGPGEIVHNNIAVIDMAAGLWDDAERELDAELSLNPQYARAYANLAIVLRHEGRDDEADAADESARALVAP